MIVRFAFFLLILEFFKQIISLWFFLTDNHKITFVVLRNRTHICIFFSRQLQLQRRLQAIGNKARFGGRFKGSGSGSSWFKKC